MSTHSNTKDYLILQPSLIHRSLAYIQLLRPKDWAKNLFLFIPLFFSGELFRTDLYPALFMGFLAYSFVASSIYIINDYRDIEDDRKHPDKCKRPLASGMVSKPIALILAVALLASGFIVAYSIKEKFLFVLAIYFALNFAYSFGLKTIPILDIIILAA